MKYLLDELHSYENDYSGLLGPVQREVDVSFLGEHSSVAPASNERVELMYQSISSDMRAISGTFYNFMCGIATGMFNLFTLCLFRDLTGATSI